MTNFVQGKNYHSHRYYERCYERYCNPIFVETGSFLFTPLVIQMSTKKGEILSGNSTSPSSNTKVSGQETFSEN